MKEFNDAITAGYAAVAMPEDLRDELLARFVGYYLRNGNVFTGIQDAMAHIYDNELKEAHDIYEFSPGFLLVLPALKGFPKSVLLESLKDRKATGASGDEFQVFLRQVTDACKEVHQHLSSLRNSRRKFGVLRPAPAFPDFEELKEFHECKRKVRHSSQEEAAQSLFSGQVSYECPYCSQWHNGHPPKNSGSDPKQMAKRYQRTWRRYKDL